MLVGSAPTDGETSTFIDNRVTSAVVAAHQTPSRFREHVNFTSPSPLACTPTFDSPSNPGISRAGEGSAAKFTAGYFDGSVKTVLSVGEVDQFDVARNATTCVAVGASKSESPTLGVGK